MNGQTQQILTKLTQYLIDNPETRFGQALMNIGVNQFASPTNPALEKHLLRDIYNDTNEQILKRITK